MTLDQALDSYLFHLQVERGLADNTLQSYRHDL
ncbi:MAG: site-specific tyrosine recombinase XerD, partial [Deltaproteobacteria bacterium CG_4_9_14_3_um_filter_63_12]